MLDTAGADDWLRSLLETWARSASRPLVLLFEEVDALVGDTLISLLRQIRAGYAQRPAAFPQAVVLCGVRDVRDYRIHTAHHEIITGGSAFNIKAKSLRLGNFSRAETTALWQQHQMETGQQFDPHIWPELWADTEAQGYCGPVQRIVLELKLWKKCSLDASLKDGIPQTVDYARQCGDDEAHLIVFDRRPDSLWDERIWQRQILHDGWMLGLWGA
jgi:hypothetical protein